MSHLLEVNHKNTAQITSVQPLKTRIGTHSPHMDALGPKIPLSEVNPTEGYPDELDNPFTQGQ